MQFMKDPAITLKGALGCSYQEAIADAIKVTVALNARYVLLLLNDEYVQVYQCSTVASVMDDMAKFNHFKQCYGLLWEGIDASSK